MADINDVKVKETIKRVMERWGGNFSFKMGIPWKQVIKEWKAKNGVTVHLTAYGENIQTSDVMKRITEKKQDVLVIVGSQKVPSRFFTEAVSDFNVAVGNQPHSECSSLAVFLDRFFEGQELLEDFVHNANMKIVPQARGKKVVKV